MRALLADPRYTPTPVGKTRCLRVRSRASAVHPHACGENSWKSDIDFVYNGTPPRLWGKRMNRAVMRRKWRYTPTPVGKTCSQRTSRPSLSVHPHACGENGVGVAVHVAPFRYTPTPVGKTSLAGAAKCADTGTPPRLWGKRRPLIAKLFVARYTPTPVGKTGTLSSSNSATTVHPHACGENAAYAINRVINSGTPPRLWGKRCAQNPLSTILPVHPHACGENQVVLVSVSPFAGTPPRLWGKRLMQPWRGRVFRYTPTPVGKTRHGGIRQYAHPVHPHACGENGKSNLGRRGAFGTPPRLWGKHLSHHRRSARPRYTPTPVGKTIGRRSWLGK